METNRDERNSLKIYAITYSYPTNDRYYRGQRGIRVEARNQAEALRKIQRGHGGYSPCPDARIVRAKVVESRCTPKGVGNVGGYGGDLMEGGY